MAERFDGIEIDGPRETRFDAVSHGAGAESVLHLHDERSPLRGLGLPRELGDALAGDPADLLADGLGGVLPSPEPELLPFRRESALLHVLVEERVPLVPSVALARDHLEFRQIGSGTEADPVQPAGVPDVVRFLLHEQIEPNVHGAPVLDGGCPDLSGRPGVPPDPGLRVASLGFVLALSDEGQDAVGEVFGDRPDGRSELVGLAAPPVVLRRRSEVHEIAEERIGGRVLLDELEVVPSADVVDVVDGLVELQPRVHEQDGQVESRIQCKKEGDQAVLPSGERYDRWQVVLGDGVLDESRGLRDPLLDDGPVGFDDLVPCVGGAYGCGLLGLVPSRLHGHAFRRFDHLGPGHPGHPGGDDLPLGREDDDLVPLLDVGGGVGHSGRHEVLALLDEFDRSRIADDPSLGCHLGESERALHPEDGLPSDAHVVAHRCDDDAVDHDLVHAVEGRGLAEDDHMTLGQNGETGSRAVVLVQEGPDHLDVEIEGGPRIPGRRQDHLFRRGGAYRTFLGFQDWKVAAAAPPEVVLPETYSAHSIDRA